MHKRYKTWKYHHKLEINLSWHLEWLEKQFTVVIEPNNLIINAKMHTTNHALEINLFWYMEGLEKQLLNQRNSS